MNLKTRAHVGSLLQREEGQVLPWMVMLTILFLGMAGLTLDLGHAYVSHRELQASTDAAALAGAYEMSQSTATSTSVGTAVSAASSEVGGKNVNANLSSAKATPTLKCLNTVTNSGVLCSASPVSANAIEVVQTADVPTFFIRALAAFGVNSASSIKIAATSTAAMRGAQNSPYNVAIVVDTTASMGNNDNDASCNNTRIYCALSGIQTLLKSLSPCTASTVNAGCTAFDQVSLFTFPNVKASTASNDTTCPTSNPTVMDYYLPAIPSSSTKTWTPPTGSSATYQITGYLNNYSSTNVAGGSLSTSSALTIATGGSGVKNCKGMQTPGGAGTYYAGVIYAAETSLLAAKAANPSSQNALVILSDGDASSSNISGGKHSGNVYGSLDDQCTQAITAAKHATANGIDVYTVAYGASSSGCSTDTGSYKVSPCSALQQMASQPSYFYSDATASQNKGQCHSTANPDLTLDQIFKQVATQFTNARLIPNGTT